MLCNWFGKGSDTQYLSGGHLVSKGDGFFLRAQQLGARDKAQKSTRKSAMKNAGQDQKRVVANYLLLKDPERYKWAEYYLSPDL